VRHHSGKEQRATRLKGDGHKRAQVELAHVDLAVALVFVDERTGAVPRVEPRSTVINPWLLESIDAFMRIGADPRGASDSATRALREALLWQLLLWRENQSGVPVSQPLERVAALARRIRENSAHAWTIDRMAAECGLSGGHLRRLFGTVTGVAPLQFVLQCRMERACYYLRETRLPIGAIASATGYADVFFFSRQFKERMGVSPSAYREGAH